MPAARLHHRDRVRQRADRARRLRQVCADEEAGGERLGADAGRRLARLALLDEHGGRGLVRDARQLVPGDAEALDEHARLALGADGGHRPAEVRLAVVGVHARSIAAAIVAALEPTPSAVLVPVYRDPDGELRVVLVVRGAHGFHGGQLGLPGGKWQPGDVTLERTALREAEEEIGLRAADVDVLAELDALDTVVSGFRVHPFLARIRPADAWRLAEGEIDEIVTPPVRAFADPALRGEHPFLAPAWPEPRLVEGVVLEGGHLVWGFTLRLLDGLMPRLLAGEWDV